MEGSMKHTVPSFARGLQVLLVDHDMISLINICSMLQEYTFNVTSVHQASTALTMIRESKTPYKLVVADINLPDMDYETFLHELCRREIPLIWMSNSPDVAMKAIIDGASYLLTKPISMNDLKPVWQHAFRRRSNQKESQGIEIREAGGASGSAAGLDLPAIQNGQVVKEGQVNQISDNLEDLDNSWLDSLLNGDSQRNKGKGLITTTNNQQEGSKHKRPIDDQQGNTQDKRIRNNSEHINLEFQELNQNERGRQGDGNSNAERRTRAVWNAQLRSKFTAAITELGDSANPKSIFEKMNDPSIALTQVASQFQKFKSSVQKMNVDNGTSLTATNNLYSYSRRAQFAPIEMHSSLAHHPGNKNLNFGVNTQSTTIPNSLTQPGNDVASFLSYDQRSPHLYTGQMGVSSHSNLFREQNRNGVQIETHGMHQNLHNMMPSSSFLYNSNMNRNQVLEQGNRIQVPEMNLPNVSYGTSAVASPYNLPNFPPYANQNQDLTTNLAASFSSRYQNQLPAGFAATTELLASAQARITSGIATNPDNLPSNFSDGIQNLMPTVELGPVVGLPNFPPYANQNQVLTTNFAAPFNSKYQNQLPAGVATTTEQLGSGQPRRTSATEINPEIFPKNFSVGIQNLEPMVELGPAAGLPNFPPYANQSQDCTTNLAAPLNSIYQNQFPAGVATTTELLGFGQATIINSGIATNSENFLTNFGDGIQNLQPIVEMAPAAGSSRHPPYSNQNQYLSTILASPFNSRYQNQFPAGVATTELLGSGQITSGIATNSENFPMNFRDGIQNLQPIVKLAPAAGLSKHPAYANQNQDLNAILTAPFSTRHRSQLAGGGVAVTTELVGSVQGQITSGIATNSENFLMNFSDGIQNLEPMVEQALAAGSSDQNQPLSELADKLTIHEDETADLDGIFNSLNPGDIEQNQEPMVEQVPAAGSSNHGFNFLDDEEFSRLFSSLEPLDFELLHDLFGESTNIN